MSWKIEKLGIVVTHRKEFIIIDNSIEYKRCRVQVNRKGVVLRDVVKGIVINTKKQQVCKEGDFLVAEIDAKVGGYGFVGKDLEGAIVSSHYFLFEVDETKLLKDYLAWLIRTDIIQEQITSKGSTNYAAIRPHHVLDFEIPLPPVADQALIVNRINNINTEYCLLDKELYQQQTYLQQLRQAILQEAVQGEMSEPRLPGLKDDKMQGSKRILSSSHLKNHSSDEDAAALLKRIKAEKEKLIKAGKLKKEKELPPITEDEIPFELPEGWVWCRWRDLLAAEQYSMKRGPFGSSLRKDMFVDKGIRVFEQYNPINDDPYWVRYYITEKKYEELKAFTAIAGDLLISCSGATLGRITALPKDVEFGIINQALLKLTLDKNIISNEYFIRLFRSSFIQETILEKAGGSAIPNMVGVSTLKEILIPLPPLAEQQHIVAKVQQLQQHLSQLEAQVQQSRQYAQQLLQSVLKEAFEEKGKVYEMGEMVSMLAEE